MREPRSEIQAGFLRYIVDTAPQRFAEELAKTLCGGSIHGSHCIVQEIPLPLGEGFLDSALPIHITQNIKRLLTQYAETGNPSRCNSQQRGKGRRNSRRNPCEVVRRVEQF